MMSRSPQTSENEISRLVPAVFRVFEKDELVFVTDDHLNPLRLAPAAALPGQGPRSPGPKDT